jgi:hypothetical protein
MAFNANSRLEQGHQIAGIKLREDKVSRNIGAVPRIETLNLDLSESNGFL